MASGRLQIDLAVTPARALARGQSLLCELSEASPVVAYGAEMSSASVVLGAYQHAPHALRGSALAELSLPVLRRRTGGGALLASEGIAYFALGLRDASVLMACPPGRILNRNVRGLLAGIRALGAPAYYFGRDFVSVGQKPAPSIAIGWDEAGDGRVLLEFFIACATSFALPPALDGYPYRSSPAWGGKPVATLRDQGRGETAGEVLASIADGYARGFGVRWDGAELPDAWLARALAIEPALTADPGDERGLCWSRPHEEAIGFVSAGAAFDELGAFTALELGGDFYQQRERSQELRGRLLGVQAEPAAIGAAVDAVYGTPGAIEGVRSLTTLREAILNTMALG
jgi:hypothetical protein